MWKLLSYSTDARTVSNVIPFYIFNRAKRDVTCWLVYTVTGHLKSKKPPAQTRLKSTHKRSQFVHKLSSQCLNVKHREKQQLVSDKQMSCLMTDDWMFVWGQDKTGEIRSCVDRGLNRKTTIWRWMKSSTGGSFFSASQMTLQSNADLRLLSGFLMISFMRRQVVCLKGQSTPPEGWPSVTRTHQVPILAAFTTCSGTAGLFHSLTR
jgi:hypothetical protein